MYHGLIKPDEDGGNPIAAKRAAVARPSAARRFCWDISTLQLVTFWWGNRSQKRAGERRGATHRRSRGKPKDQIGMEFVDDIVAHLPDQAEW
jgi:hypothetical protein